MQDAHARGPLWMTSSNILFLFLVTVVILNMFRHASLYLAVDYDVYKISVLMTSIFKAKSIQESQIPEHTTYIKSTWSIL